MSGKPKLFFTSTMTTTFILEDLQMLQQHFEVTSYFGHGLGGILHALRGPMNADLALSWFGSVYSLPMVWGANIRHIPSVIMVAGIDVSRESSIGYGMWLSGWKASVLRRAFDSCSRIFVVDDSLANDLRKYAGIDWQHIETIPFGFDPDEWSLGSMKRSGVITVARTNEDVHFKRKGLPFLINAARNLSDISFTVVGTPPALPIRLGFEVPPNMKFIDAVQRKDIVGLLQRSKVYCQVSLREGLPNALCEAMLCGCIPIGTRVAGIPTAMGPHGYIVDYGNVEQLCKAIRSAVNVPDGAGLEARQYVARQFNKQDRDARFVDRLMGLLE